MPNILIAVPSKKEKLPLSVTHPELAREADGWDPDSYTHGSDKKMSWKCQASHIWIATISNRSLLKTGCPYCSGQKVLAGFNDLATLFPDVAKEADGWDPNLVTARTRKKKAWTCSLGHRWNASISDRTIGTGCPYCAGQKVLAGFNDLAFLDPDLASEAYGWDATEFTIKSGAKKTWRCKLGHMYETSIRHRSNGTNCPVCSGSKTLVGFNDLKTTHPFLAEEAEGWDPTLIGAGSGLTKKWRCHQGHVWSTRVIHRKNGVGCPSCSETGFNPNKKGFLYFLTNPDWEMMQIGITNVPDDRLDRHKRSGWQTLEVRGPMDGHLTMQWETAILRMLKAKGADLSNEKIAGKFDGYSEAWSKSTFEVSSIREMMKLTEEYEEEK